MTGLPRLVAHEAALARAKAWAGRVRICAVEDVTHLDPLGVPVFITERDTALGDRFAYGRGPAAELGAYLEAIEHHFAEPGSAAIETRRGLPREPLAEYAPKLHHRAPADILLARAHDAETGAAAWIPAELAFCPAPVGCETLFGASSNGLACGNSVPEASLHALTELIERDIWSIEFVRDASARVTHLPGDARAIEETAARRGLHLVVRHVPNDFTLPFFAAFLFDPKDPRSRFFNGGWGCDFDAHAALMRAVSEAVQSRIAFLHGGREAPEEEPNVSAQIEAVSRIVPAVAFDDIAGIEIGGIDAQWGEARARLRRVTDRPIYRVIFTPEEGPLHVVRLVVPMLEHFAKDTMRVGPRLQAELEWDAA